MNNLDNIINFGFSVEYHKSTNTVNISYHNYRTKANNIRVAVESIDDIYSVVEKEFKKIIRLSQGLYKTTFNIDDPTTITKANHVDFIQAFLFKYIRDRYNCPVFDPKSVPNSLYDDIYEIINDHNDRINRDYPNKIDKRYDELIKRNLQRECLNAVACIGAAYGYTDIVSLCILHNNTYNSYRSVLWAACSNNQLDILKFLHSIKINIHIDNELALLYAITSNSVDVAAYLIQYGAQFNEMITAGFITACTNGYNEIVDLLLVHGITIDSQYGSAIKNAIKNHHSYIIAKLLSYGINNSKYFDDILECARKESLAGYDYAYRILSEK